MFNLRFIGYECKRNVNYPTPEHEEFAYPYEGVLISP